MHRSNTRYTPFENDPDAISQNHPDASSQAGSAVAPPRPAVNQDDDTTTPPTLEDLRKYHQKTIAMHEARMQQAAAAAAPTLARLQEEHKVSTATELSTRHKATEGEVVAAFHATQQLKEMQSEQPVDYQEVRIVWVKEYFVCMTYGNLFPTTEVDSEMQLAATYFNKLSNECQLQPQALMMLDTLAKGRVTVVYLPKETVLPLTEKNKVELLVGQFSNPSMFRISSEKPFDLGSFNHMVVPIRTIVPGAELRTVLPEAELLTALSEAERFGMIGAAVNNLRISVNILYLYLCEDPHNVMKTAPAEYHREVPQSFNLRNRLAEALKAHRAHVQINCIKDPVIYMLALAEWLKSQRPSFIIPYSLSIAQVMKQRTPNRNAHLEAAIKMPLDANKHSKRPTLDDIRHFVPDAMEIEFEAILWVRSQTLMDPQAAQTVSSQLIRKIFYDTKPQPTTQHQLEWWVRQQNPLITSAQVDEVWRALPIQQQALRNFLELRIHDLFNSESFTPDMTPEAIEEQARQIVGKIAVLRRTAQDEALSLRSSSQDLQAQHLQIALHSETLTDRVVVLILAHLHSSYTQRVIAEKVQEQRDMFNHQGQCAYRVLMSVKGISNEEITSYTRQKADAEAKAKSKDEARAAAAADDGQITRRRSWPLATAPCSLSRRVSWPILSNPPGAAEARSNETDPTH